MTSSSRKGAHAWPAALAAVAALVCLLASHQISRPLSVDETANLRKYSGFGYDGLLGTDREGGGPGEAIRGVYRVFAARWDPQNHIPHNLFLSVVTGFLGYSEWTVRLVSATSFLGATALLAWWVGRITGPWVGFLASLAFASHPWILFYAQQSRGYLLAILLILGQLMWVESRALRSIPLLRALVGAALALAIALNLVSLVAWVGSLYVARLWLARPDPDRDAPTGWRERETILVEATVVAVGFALFIAANVRELVLAQIGYGVKIDSTGGAFRELTEILHELFPGPWLAVLPLSFVGLWLSSARSRNPFGLAAALSLVAVAAHGLLGHSILYARTQTYLIPFALVALAWLVGTWPPKRVRYGLFAATTVVLVLTTTWNLHWLTKDPELLWRDLYDYNTLAEGFAATAAAHGDSPATTLVVLPDSAYGRHMVPYLPPDPRWRDLEVPLPTEFIAYFPVVKLAGGCRFDASRDPKGRVVWELPPDACGLVAAAGSPGHEGYELAWLRIPWRRAGVESRSAGSGHSPELVLARRETPVVNLDALAKELIRDSTAPESRWLTLPPNLVLLWRESPGPGEPLARLRLRPWIPHAVSTARYRISASSNLKGVASTTPVRFVSRRLPGAQRNGG